MSGFCPLTTPERVHLLANETTTFTFPSGICVLREKQLGSVQDVHEHRQLRLDQGPETVLQCRDNVLEWKHALVNSAGLTLTTAGSSIDFCPEMRCIGKAVLE